MLLNADGKGEMVNLTESGYNDGNAKWVLDGKAMIWTSDRAGYRSHGSWGAEDDTYIMFFDADVYKRQHLLSAYKSVWQVPGCVLRDGWHKHC